jgi:hypothetical protein
VIGPSHSKRPVDPVLRRRPAMSAKALWVAQPRGDAHLALDREQNDALPADAGESLKRFQQIRRMLAQAVLRRRLSRQSSALAAGASLLFCCAVATASPIGIDNFANPSAVYFSGPLSMSQQSTGILGGQRDLSIVVNGPVLVDSVVGLVGSDNTPGYHLNALQIGLAGESPAVVTLQYSGLHDTPGNAYALGGSPGAPLDLTRGGSRDSFGLHFQSLDALLEVSITITSPAGSNYAAQSSTVTEFVPPSSSPFDFLMPFAFLLGTASPSRADSITIVLNGNKQPNLDFEFQAVPEPGGAALIATGIVTLCGLGLRRSRRPRGDGLGILLPPR